mmetsp:Transcript_134546/g.287867  ORF Transcript_134546/g.287867 Transcript_134546/m.287867 type:complete len:84 (+) Transcript_134546:76-327(+)
MTQTMVSPRRRNLKVCFSEGKMVPHPLEDPFDAELVRIKRTKAYNACSINGSEAGTGSEENDDSDSDTALLRIKRGNVQSAKN